MESLPNASMLDMVGYLELVHRLPEMLRVYSVHTSRSRYLSTRMLFPMCTCVSARNASQADRSSGSEDDATEVIGTPSMCCSRRDGIRSYQVLWCDMSFPFLVDSYSPKYDRT